MSHLTTEPLDSIVVIRLPVYPQVQIQSIWIVWIYLFGISPLTGTPTWLLKIISKMIEASSSQMFATLFVHHGRTTISVFFFNSVQWSLERLQGSCEYFCLGSVFDLPIYFPVTEIEPALRRAEWANRNLSQSLWFFSSNMCCIPNRICIAGFSQGQAEMLDECRTSSKVAQNDKHCSQTSQNFAQKTQGHPSP